MLKRGSFNGNIQALELSRDNQSFKVMALETKSTHARLTDANHVKNRKNKHTRNMCSKGSISTILTYK